MNSGLKFWKAPNRKLYAVPSEDIIRGSELSGINRERHRDDDDVTNPIHEKINTISSDL